MKWLLLLYPPRWRKRYGAELADLVSSQAFSVGAAADLLAGAVDAWVNPQLVPEPPQSKSKGDVTMIARMMQLTCAGYGATITRTDHRKNAVMNIGGTLVLVSGWLVTLVVWKQRHLAGSDYIVALLPMTYLLPYLIGLRYTSLKGRSSGAQAAFIGSTGAVLAGILLGACWIATKI
jgi:hypothetical protein